MPAASGGWNNSNHHLRLPFRSVTRRKSCRRWSRYTTGAAKLATQGLNEDMSQIVDLTRSTPSSRRVKHLHAKYEIHLSRLAVNGSGTDYSPTSLSAPETRRRP